jgi:hypothetical protein
MFFIQRDVSYGQFANCLAVLHVGYTAVGISAPAWLRRRGCYAARIELFTDGHRFRFSGFSLEKLRRAAPNWMRCPSTHCERHQECRTPHECAGTGRAKLYAMGGPVRSDRKYIVGERPNCQFPL